MCAVAALKLLKVVRYHLTNPPIFDESLLLRIRLPTAKTLLHISERINEVRVVGIQPL